MLKSLPVRYTGPFTDNILKFRGLVIILSHIVNTYMLQLSIKMFAKFSFTGYHVFTCLSSSQLSKPGCDFSMLSAGSLGMLDSQLD
jgi:hypothetical protein